MKNTILDVFGIPELHEHICHHLTPHDFVACVQVNKTFCDLFLPLLWHTVNLVPSIEYASTDHFILTSEFLSQIGREATAKNGHLIKSFKTKDPGSVAVFPKTCTNLYHLCIGDIGDCVRFESSTGVRSNVTPEVMAAMGRNPGVMRFRMDTIDGDITEFMDTVVRSFPILESLTIGLKVDQLIHLVNPGGFLDTCPNTLRKLTLIFHKDGSDSDDDWVETSNEFVSQVACQQNRLTTFIKTLKLKNCQSLNSFPLIELFNRLPCLETLRLDNQEFDSPRLLAETLARSCPQLAHLDFFDSSCYDDRYIALLLGASAGWKTIRAPYSISISSECFEVILDRSASTLENFVYERNYTLCETEAHQLLTRFENLQTCALDLWCDASLMIQPPTWACVKSMVSLCIVINGIPRPDIKENHNKRPLGEELLHRGDSMEDSRKLQKQVYARLGTLTQLKCLTLGTNFNEHHWADNRESGYSNDIGVVVDGYQYECLEFTLESGLGEMAGLKNLVTLDLTRMSTRIRIIELEWMIKNWPRLETIIDLFPQGDTPDPEVEAWLKNNGRADWHVSSTDLRS
ncbi:hypothetical protein BGZ93_005191 [Podila epicladia]|nr:hypothetical protein BGZ92_004654 [Podila epicladia]KAG0099935.1 hypothetical protein BGZ93_005191 [Podila epicladia]